MSIVDPFIPLLQQGCNFELEFLCLPPLPTYRTDACDVPGRTLMDTQPCMVIITSNFKPTWPVVGDLFSQFVRGVW